MRGRLFLFVTVLLHYRPHATRVRVRKTQYRQIKQPIIYAQSPHINSGGVIQVSVGNITPNKKPSQKMTVGVLINMLSNVPMVFGNNPEHIPQAPRP